MRSDRRRDLLRILHEGGATSQQQMVQDLRAAGHDVTQATVSRDLRELGATKVRVAGRLAYRLPDEIPRAPGGDLMARSLMRTLSEFALDFRGAGSIVVVLTAPGHASAVARAIDLAALDEVAGTVAGDDTIFVATPDAATAAKLSARWGRGGRMKAVEAT
jgi:transcriptional regulator of arginine metabolism